MQTEVCKLRAGKYRFESTLHYKDGRIYIDFPYNVTLKDEIKTMEGPKWHGFDSPPRKIWSVKDCNRNRFHLGYLKGEDVFARYDAELLPYESTRPLRDHQLEMTRFCITRRYCILAAEMGTGKTLVAIELMEWIKDNEGLEDYEAWYIGPKSGVRAVTRELRKWESRVKPRMFTYDKMVSAIKNWDGTILAPKVVIFDESSKLKTPTSQRSQCALHLADSIRTEHGDKGAVIEMSGTPSPKSPVDWYHQAEVACPGFIKEGNVHKFKATLCLTEMRESLSGGSYPHVITWLDDENKCNVCGQTKDDEAHKDGLHPFEPSVNEVSRLHKRLQGLVDIRFKSDCTDLPDKQYRVIQVQPTPEVLRAAQLIKAKSTRAIQALTLLRELSDGFQYTEEKIGTQPCRECGGTGKVTELIPSTEADPTQPESFDMEEREHTCYQCAGTCEEPVYARATDNYSSPKDQVFIDMLDEHSDIGRFVVWGGFTGTIERLIDISHQYGWATLRYDKIVKATGADGSIQNVDEFLDAMDRSFKDYKKLLDKHPKICFIGHPDAGGQALTLHAAPTALYYSNSFKGESRIQSEDRIHRLGMDDNKGATIVDLIHLDTDLLVLENLKKKKRLQNLTLAAVKDSFTDTDAEIERYV